MSGAGRFSLGSAMIVLKPSARRVVYVAAFESLAILLSTPLLAYTGGGAVADSLPVAAAVSAIAVVWNYAFNAAFESWERRRRSPSRTVRVRLAHAVGFELGLVVLTIPLYMAWYRVGVWQALTMEAAILAFFLAYTFVFTLAFDRVFALPHAQAQRAHVPPA